MFNKKSTKVVLDKLPIAREAAEDLAKRIDGRREKIMRKIISREIGDDYRAFHRRLQKVTAAWIDVENLDFEDTLRAQRVCEISPARFMRLSGASEKLTTADAAERVMSFFFDDSSKADVLKWLEKRYGFERDNEKPKKSDLRPLMSARISAPQKTSQIDEIAAELFDEMPWMAKPLTVLWKAARERVGSEVPLPPILLHGPPGWGKSTLARRFGEVCGRPSVVLDAGSAGGSFRIAGTEKGWSSSQSGVPVETMIATGVADPVVIVDEIDKAVAARSEKTSDVCSMSNALLPLMEPGTAAAWQCPYYRVRLDMRRISWILTANEIDRVPEPLRDRCLVIHCPRPVASDLRAAAAALARKEGIEDPDAVAAAIASSEPQSLRAVARFIARIKSDASSPQLH